MSTSVPHAQLQLSKSGMVHNYKYFRSLLKESTKLMILVKSQFIRTRRNRICPCNGRGGCGLFWSCYSY